MIKYKKVLTYDKDRTVTNSKHWSIWLPFLKDTFSVKKIILQMSLNKYLSRFIVRIYFFSRESSRHCRVVLSSSVHTEAIINFSVFGRGSTVESFHCPFAAACKHGLCVCHCTLCVCVCDERERERERCVWHVAMLLQGGSQAICTCGVREWVTIALADCFSCACSCLVWLLARQAIRSLIHLMLPAS